MASKQIQPFEEIVLDCDWCKGNWQGIACVRVRVRVFVEFFIVSARIFCTRQSGEQVAVSTHSICWPCRVKQSFFATLSKGRNSTRQ